MNDPLRAEICCSYVLCQYSCDLIMYDCRFRSIFNIHMQRYILLVGLQKEKCIKMAS